MRIQSIAVALLTDPARTSARRSCTRLAYSTVVNELRCVCVFRSEQREPMLPEIDPSARRRAMELHVDLRYAVLVQKRVERRSDRQVACARDRLQKIVRGRRA